ncbi:MAG TPA: RNA polymerase sigma factor [Micromonosporaceae bacterium]
MTGDSVDAADALTAAIAAARDGDDDAFRTVYRLVQPSLLRYLSTLIRRDAEDIASEAWLQIARDLQSFHGDGDAFRGWAATIGRHRALDHIRYHQRRPAAAVPTQDFADRAADDDTSIDAVDALGSERALSLIRSLPADQAEAVLLRVIMGLDAQTAALVLGKRAGAVRTASYRGLRRLAALLTEPEPTDADRAPRRTVTPTSTWTLKGTT